MMERPSNEDSLEPSLVRLALSNQHDCLEEREQFHTLEASRDEPQDDDHSNQRLDTSLNRDSGRALSASVSPSTSIKASSPALSNSMMFASTSSHDKQIPRNVSFIKGSETSMAYKEHNPPAILRQTDASEGDQATEPASRANSVAVAPGNVALPGERKEGEGAIKPKPKGAKEKKDELHILIGVSGSVATIKVGPIIHKLKQIYRERAIIQLVATKASCVFFKPADVPRDVKIWYDEDEWESRDGKPDSSLHMELRRWADILLVAPCSANTLAKLTYGICDNLLTSVFRVWNPAVPLLVAPAMNTHMYTNPVTKRHYKVLKDLYPFVEILKPVEKVLVCGDIGMGGMREWTDIVQILVKRLGVEPEDVDDEDDS